MKRRSATGRLLLAARLSAGLTAGLALSGCADLFAPAQDVTRAAVELPAPPLKHFGPYQAVPPQRANADMIRDFLDLSFRLESGAALSSFSRIKQPVTIRVLGQKTPESFVRDFSTLLQRLRREAGIDVASTTDPDATITVNLISPEVMKRLQPRAACFVVPGISDLSQYNSAARMGLTDWRQLQERARLAIFIPEDAPPQEMRDCLHEEISQAIGPLNDLYRLPDSIFNDDNIHTVLTGFDMLMLRVTYDPALRPGMRPDEVAERLPAIFRRLNPAGERIAPAPLQTTTVDWMRAINTALGPNATDRQRTRASNRALAIARQQGWTDHRLGLGYFLAGRAALDSNQATGRAYLDAADRIYASQPVYELSRTRSLGQLAALDLQDGDPERAVQRLDQAIPIAIASQNATILTGLLVLRSEALLDLGRAEEARAVRLDTLGWARYGFGNQWAERSNVEIVIIDETAQQTDG